MNRTRTFLGLFLFISFFVVGLASAGPTSGKRTVTFRPGSDFSGQPAVKEQFGVPEKKATAQVETVVFKLATEDCSLFSAPEGYDYFDAGGLKTSGRPGEPQVPMKTFVVELDKDAQVYGVEVVTGVFSKVVQDVNLVPVPEPSVYNMTGDRGGRYLADAKIYGQGALFPGKLVAYETGSDNEHLYVFVRLFPLQYTPNKRKAELLTEATINVYYGSKVVAAEKVSRPPAPPEPPPAGTMTLSLTDAANVIICPSGLSAQAVTLSNLHNGEGQTTAIVTTEDIAASYAPAEDPAYNGYNNSTNSGHRNIKNYDYVLAKKIVSYLRDTAMHPNLTTVTILGDGLLVPPSYYIFSPVAQTSYGEWPPTDLYYASPDYDYVPNFRVGRLPVSDSAEAQAMIDKIVRWTASANWSWFDKAYVVGGDPHVEHLYCAEMNIKGTLGLDYLSGMDISKCFLSDGTENKTAVEPAVRDGHVGWVYHIGHASGYAISLNGNPMFYGTDILAYPTTVNNLPVFVSTGCNNGAFDMDLYTQRTWNTSFAECLLKSKAGAIAYFGGVREQAGDGVFYYDQGNLVISDQTGCLALYNNIFESYHQGADNLGVLYFDAIANYVTDHDMSGYDTLNTTQVFLFCFLGDPVLRIPVQQTAAEYSQAVNTAVNAQGYDSSGIPQFAAAPVTVTAATTSPTVKWKWIDPVTKNVLEGNTLDYGPVFSRTFSASAEQQYLVRTSTQSAVPSTDYSKEGWLIYAINSNAGLMVHVSDIEMGLVTAGKNRHATARVTVVNQVGAPVSGATVTGHWSGLTSDTDSAVTGSNGQVIISSDNVGKTVPGTFTFCVDGIALSGATYDYASNVETCDSIQAFVF